MTKREPGPLGPIEMFRRYRSPAPKGPPVAMFVGGFGLGAPSSQASTVPSSKVSIWPSITAWACKEKIVAQANAAKQPRDQGDRGTEPSERGGDFISAEEIKIKARRSLARGLAGARPGSRGGAATVLGEPGEFSSHDQLGALFLEVVIDMIKGAADQMDAEATGLDEIEGTSL